jgi:hypothetical protein
MFSAPVTSLKDREHAQRLVEIERGEKREPPAGGTPACAYTSSVRSAACQAWKLAARKGKGGANVGQDVWQECLRRESVVGGDDTQVVCGCGARDVRWNEAAVSPHETAP